MCLFVYLWRNVISNSLPLSPPPRFCLWPPILKSYCFQVQVWLIAHFIQSFWKLYSIPLFQWWYPLRINKSNGTILRIVYIVKIKHTSCVTVVGHFSEPYFPHLQNKNKNKICLTSLLGLNAISGAPNMVPVISIIFKNANSPLRNKLQLLYKLSSTLLQVCKWSRCLIIWAKSKN